MAGGGNPFGTPAGIAGIQHTYQLLFSEGVVKRGLPLEKFVELSSSNAAKRYRLYPQKGLIAVGADADFAILNPDKEWIIRKEDLKQMIKWTPYDLSLIHIFVLHSIILLTQSAVFQKWQGF